MREKKMTHKLGHEIWQNKRRLKGDYNCKKRHQNENSSNIKSNAKSVNKIIKMTETTLNDIIHKWKGRRKIKKKTDSKKGENL